MPAASDPTGGIDDLGLAVAGFAAETAGVTTTVVVSADGFVLASNPAERLPGVEQLAAIISGLSSLANGAATFYQLDVVRQVIVEMDGGYLFIVSTGVGCSIGTLTDTDAELGELGYDLTVLSQRVARLLTPDRVDTLKNAVGPTPAEGFQ